MGRAGPYDYATIAYDASTGTRLWVRRYNGPGNGDDEAQSVTPSSDGSQVFVTGFSTGLTSGYDYATIAYDASTGKTLWVRRFTGPGNALDIPNAIASSSDASKVFVTGQTDGAGGDADYATIAYDAVTGATLWVRLFTGPQFSNARSLAPSSDGSKVFVTGHRGGGSDGDADYVTFAYDATTGAPLWHRQYNSPANGDDYAYSVAASRDGSTVFVTGQSYRPTSSFDYVTIAYDASSGSMRWLRRYNAAANNYDYPSWIAVSPDSSKVVVTGTSIGQTSNFDFATVAYDTSTGSTLWVMRLSGPGAGADFADSVAVSPDSSKVFVTGSRLGRTGNYDYATIAYRA
jgi:hypothetical protein